MVVLVGVDKGRDVDQGGIDCVDVVLREGQFVFASINCGNIVSGTARLLFAIILSGSVTTKK